MEVRSEALGSKCDKLSPPMLLRRSRLQVWLIRVCSCILLWTCLIQLVAVGELWHPRLPKYWHGRLGFGDSSSQLTRITSFSLPSQHAPVPAPPPLPPISISSLPLLLCFLIFPQQWKCSSNRIMASSTHSCSPLLGIAHLSLLVRADIISHRLGWSGPSKTFLQITTHATLLTISCPLQKIIFVDFYKYMICFS